MNANLRSHGQVLSLLFDRATPGRLLAGLNAQRSLYSSDDGGVTWSPSSGSSSPDGAPWPPPAYALIQSARSPLLVMAATGGGLYRSADAGRTWRAVATGIGARPAYALAQDASGLLYLGGEGGAPFSSADDGLTWTALSPLPAGTAILSLAVSPSSDWLLAGTDGAGLFSSRDRGATWRRVDAVGETFVSGLVLRPAGSLPCGAAGDCVMVRARSGLFTTIDGGLHWSEPAAAWDGRVDAVTAGGTDPAWFLATDRGMLYRSVDGRSWDPWGDGLGRAGAIFLAASDPGRPDRLFVGTENGLYISTDAGRQWQPSAGGPGDPSADALAQSSDGLLYLANLDGVYVSPDSGRTWERRSQGLPPVPTLAVASAPSAPARLYAGATGAGLFRSDDGGHTWAATGWEAASVPGIAVDPSNPDRVYFRVAFQRVYSSDDGGKTVLARWNGFTTFTEIMSLVVDGGNPDRLYAGGTEALYRSLDGAASWQAVAPELDGQTVFALVVDQAHQRLFAGATKGVYASGDGGRSWRRLGSGLEDVTVTALALDPLQPARIYAGTRYNGTYRSEDNGRTWHHAGLDGASVNALLVSLDGGWLYAATPEGFFRAEVR